VILAKDITGDLNLNPSSPTTYFLPENATVSGSIRLGSGATLVLGPGGYVTGNATPSLGGNHVPVDKRKPREKKKFQKEGEKKKATTADKEEEMLIDSPEKADYTEGNNKVQQVEENHKGPSYKPNSSDESSDEALERKRVRLHVAAPRRTKADNFPNRRTNWNLHTFLWMYATALYLLLLVIYSFYLSHELAKAWRMKTW